MLTVVILTHNEEEVIEDCLRSLSYLTQDILVVDSRSSDRTVEIAKKYGAVVIDHEMENFATQRNYALGHIASNWVLYIDADERLTSEFIKEVLNLLSNYSPESNIAGFFIRRKTYYLGKDWGLTDRVQRLFYKKKLKKWFGDVHETPKVDGEFLEVSAPILHLTHRNLSQMLEKTNKWSEIEARLRYDSHHPNMSWWRFPRVMIPAFFKSYFLEKGYGNGTRGIIEGIFQSYSMFITYAKLWELQNKK